MARVKCCFLIDATGSMSPWIEAAKTQARIIMQTLQTEHPGASFQFAAVFYRDYGDLEQFYTVPFMQDITDKIQDVEAYGGDDCAEDVAGGFQRMIELDWTGATLKFAFMIADAPPHGSRWHASHISDRFRHEPQGSDLADLVQQCYWREIRLTVVKVNSTVNKMIDIFDNLYNGTLDVQDMHDQGHPPGGEPDPGMILTPMVTRLISNTLTILED